MTPIDLKDCTFYIRDGGVNYIEVKIGEGNLNFNETRQLEFVKTRGNLDRVRENEQVPVEVNFQFVWDHIISNGVEPPTVEDALKKINNASGWVSASNDPNAPYSVHLQLVMAKTCTLPNGSTINHGETLTFFEFNHQSLNHSLKDATIDCDGSCNRTTVLSERP